MLCLNFPIKGWSKGAVQCLWVSLRYVLKIEKRFHSKTDPLFSLRNNSTPRKHTNLPLSIGWIDRSFFRGRFAVLGIKRTQKIITIISRIPGW